MPYLGLSARNDVRITTIGSANLDGSVIVNESSADKDFRVESDGNTHMLFVNGGNNCVGIGNASPTSTLHITGTVNASGVVTANAGVVVDNITIDGNDISTTNSNGNLTITPNGTGDLYVNSDRLAVKAANDESATVLLGADNQDDAGDTWKITAQADHTLVFQNDKSGSSDVTHFSITPHSTVASSVANFAGKAIFANNVGINDDTPDEGKLVVRGDAGSNALFVGGNSTSGNSWGLGVNAGSTSGDASFRVYDKDGSSSYLYVRGDGNIGVGATSPDQKMHLYTSSGTTLYKAEVNANSTVGLEIKKTGTTTQTWRIVDGETVNGALQFYDVTDTRVCMEINGDGNIGIGGSPVATDVAYNTASLHLRQEGSSKGSQIHFTNAATGDAAGNGSHISLWHDDDLYITNQESDGQIKFASGGNSDALVINDSGNSTFAGNVSVDQSGGTVTLDSNGHVTSHQKLNVISAGGRLTGTSSQGDMARIDLSQTTANAHGGYLDFQTANTSGSLTQALRIDKSQNATFKSNIILNRTSGYTANWTATISHADSSENGTLFLSGDVSTGKFILRPNNARAVEVKPDNMFLIHNGASTYSQLGFYDGTTGHGWIFGGGASYSNYGGANSLNLYANGTLDLYAGNSSSVRLKCTTTGEVVIGKTTNAVATAGCRFDSIGHGYFTSSSGSVLHVHDTANYKWYVNANGGVYNYSGNNVNLSDEREKKNISSLSSKWDAVKKWSLKEFHYNSDADSDSKKVGVIAQDVETDHPDLVTEFDLTDTDKRKAVKEQQMTWMAIKALQEAMAKIETLEAKVTALEGS